MTREQDAPTNEDLLAQLESIGADPRLPDTRALQQQVDALSAEVHQLVAAHFRRAGIPPLCTLCRGPLQVAGLPCAPPALLPTPQGPRIATDLPALPVVPLRCGRCATVVYLSMELVVASAQSRLVTL